jgi:hypothetical protein
MSNLRMLVLSVKTSLPALVVVMVRAAAFVVPSPTDSVKAFSLAGDIPISSIRW